MSRQTDIAYDLSAASLGQLADIVVAISGILAERGFTQTSQDVKAAARSIRYADLALDPADAIGGTDPE